LPLFKNRQSDFTAAFPVGADAGFRSVRDRAAGPANRPHPRMRTVKAVAGSSRAAAINGMPNANSVRPVSGIGRCHGLSRLAASLDRR